MTVPVMPLSMASTGKKMMVAEIVAGAGLHKRLADMGVLPGTIVMVMGGCHPGPVLIDIRGSRLGLGFGVAQKILVKEVENAEKANCSCAGG